MESRPMNSYTRMLRHALARSVTITQSTYFAFARLNQTANRYVAEHSGSPLRFQNIRLRLMLSVLVVCIWLGAPTATAHAETITLTRPPIAGYALNSSIYPDSGSVAAKICEGPGSSVDHILFGAIRAPGYQPDIRVWCFTTIPPPDWRGEVGWSNWGEFCNLGPGWDWGTNGQCVLNIPDTQPNPDKNNGDKCSGVGNPIDPGTGNKFQLETDYIANDGSDLVFRRAYNSSPDTVYRKYYSNCAASGPLGTSWNQDPNGYYLQLCAAAPNPGMNLIKPRWTHSYDRKVSSSYLAGAATGLAVLSRPDGKALRFNLTGGVWTPDRDIADQLVRLSDAAGNTTGWILTAAVDNAVENYATDGKLMSIVSRTGLSQTLAYNAGLLSSVTNHLGRLLSFNYDGSGRMITMTDPAGQVYTYGYDNGTGMVTSVTYPDLTPANGADNPKRNYLYNEAALVGINLPQALTGIID